MAQKLSSSDIAALFVKMSEDDGDASSDSGEADDDATRTDEADPRRQFDLGFADDDATLSDEADLRRQLDLEFESVDGSDGPGRRAGRPIEHKDDPKKQKVNRRARERYKRRKLGAVRIISSASAQRQLKRNEQKGALEARDAFMGGDMVVGCRLQALVLNTPAGRNMFHPWPKGLVSYQPNALRVRLFAMFFVLALSMRLKNKQ